MRMYYSKVNLTEAELRIETISKFSALEYSLLMCLYLDAWLTEESIILRCRNLFYPVFKRISDKKIVKLLLLMHKDGHIAKEEVETDLEEDEKNDLNQINPVQVVSCGVPNT